MQINDSDFGEIGFPYDAEYITDQKGHIKSVILDYTTYKKIEEVLLDYGLAKAMEEVAEEDEVSLETAKKSSGYSKWMSPIRRDFYLYVILFARFSELTSAVKEFPSIRKKDPRKFFRTHKPPEPPAGISNH